MQRTPIGAAIQRRRLALGLTQEELGRAIDRSKMMVWKYEKGQAMPPLELLAVIARVLKTSQGHLLGERDAA